MQELQPWGSTRYEIVKGSHISFQTDKAQVDIITNPHFGRMLFIDGVLQSASADEAIYHEAIVAAVFLNKENPVKVLIAGGAEGAAAREVLKVGSVSQVVMVDWDETLVNHMRGEIFAGGAFRDPRLIVRHHDIVEYLDSCNELYDCIILDLLDPCTDAEINWLGLVFEKAYDLLMCGGNLVLNAGGNYEKVQEFIRRYKRCEVIKIFVPSFQEFWYLVRVSKLQAKLSLYSTLNTK